MTALAHTTPPIMTPSPGGAARKSPGDVSLTLDACVLRLPYPLATRVVLGEIIALDRLPGGCSASDQHFTNRFGISKDTASVAIKALHSDGLISKFVDKAAGNQRTLSPIWAAIEAKAATNPYPEKPGSTYTENPSRGATRKTPVGYPENAATPTRILPGTLPGNSGSNGTGKVTPEEDREEASPAPVVSVLTVAGLTAPAEGVTTPPGCAAPPAESDPLAVFHPGVKLCFDTDAFKAEWVKWRHHLVESGKLALTKTPTAERAMLLDLGRLVGRDEALAIQIIQQSIRRGWVALFPLKDDAKPTSQRSGAAAPGAATAPRNYHTTNPGAPVKRRSRHDE